jgi:undecaprenyl-diphosphatase
MENILFSSIAGVIQGITEWLPISSSAVLSLFANFLGSFNASEMLRYLLFLHLGTFFAALIYFKKDVFYLTKSLLNYNSSNKKTKNIINFLFISTVITGIIAGLFLYLLKKFDNKLSSLPGNFLIFFIGFLLLISAIIQIRVKTIGTKMADSLKISDGISLGFFQGLSALPGISRSGITVSALLLKKFDDTLSLKLSFLMSLPVVLAGNIFLNYSLFTFSNFMIYGLLTSFIFGILTIHGLMKLSKKINFGWFVLIFAGLMMLGGLIPFTFGV